MKKIEEEEEEGKNLYEKELIQTQLDRFRKKYTFSYYKVNESQYGKKLIETIPNMLQNDFNTIVFNFVDMMSHARTESKIIRELAGNEAAYRSLTASWFLHSSTIDFFRTLAEKKVKVVITTDHGTIHVNNAIKLGLSFLFSSSLNLSMTSFAPIKRTFGLLLFK